MEEENKMTKTIETIVMGLALATMIGCGSSNNPKENRVSCSPEYSTSYEVSKQLCGKDGSNYDCTKSAADVGYGDLCRCECVKPYTPKEPVDKGW